MTTDNNAPVSHDAAPAPQEPKIAVVDTSSITFNGRMTWHAITALLTLAASIGGSYGMVRFHAPPAAALAHEEAAQHGAKIAVLESQMADVRRDVQEIKADQKEALRLLNRLVKEK